MGAVRLGCRPKLRAWPRGCPWLPESEGRRLTIPASFSLAIAFPRRRLSHSEAQRTLRELGLAPSAALLLIEEE